MARILSKADALALFQAAVKAADPEAAVLDARLGRDARLLRGPVKVIAVGKAAPGMLRGLKRRLAREGGRVDKSWVVGLKDGGHPIPNAASVRSAKRLERALRQARPGERWIILISGGASALIGAPRTGMTLRELAARTSALLRSGASIEKINAVRKRLTTLGGGRMLELLAHAAPIEVLTLALSDVPSDRLDVIGSGPATPDPATGRRLPGSVRSAGLVVVGARQSLKAAARLARKRSYRIRELGVRTGDTRQEVARQARMARLAGSTVLISGGELGVKVRGAGRGGRNQEFVLAALCELAKTGRPFFVLAAGTDGRDGTTEAAGAWADRGTLERARKAGLDPRRFLARNDSYTFFKKVGGLIRTGPTGTNVMDFRVIHAP